MLRLLALHSLVAFVSAGGRPTALATHPVALPTKNQLAWLDLEVSAMIGWNLQTVCQPKSAGHWPVTPQRCQAGSKSEGALYVPDRAAVANWDPHATDTDEWARVAASFGAKYVVMVADHMTGFTWWDTKLHNYSIAHTRYKGGGHDIAAELIASCKKYGLKLGFFYSVHFNWFLGVDGYTVGHPPLGPKSYSQAEYLEIAKTQLREIVAMFGDEGPVEVWFDGGTGSNAAAIGPLIREIAPDALCHSCSKNFSGPNGGPVRWMGNEDGVMPLPSWSASGHDVAPGDPLGPVFSPPSADTVLREHYWFYQNDTAATTKSLKALVDTWLTSVGRASNLILNVAPDGTGAIPTSDIARYAQMGAAVECLFANNAVGAASALTMDTATGVMAGVAALTLNNSKPMATIALVLREDMTVGQLIGNYSFEYTKRKSGRSLGGAGQWTALPVSNPTGAARFEAGAESVGHKRVLIAAAPVGVAAIRATVTSHYATGTQLPELRDIQVFDWSCVGLDGQPLSPACTAAGKKSCLESDSNPSSLLETKHDARIE